jgi:hypothetical protein
MGVFKWYDFLLIVVFGILCLSLAFAFFVWTPVSLVTESRCLAKGYPKAHVTVFLETYCSNLEGSVTVRVDKLK